MGDGGTIVCEFMVHREGCAHQVEVRKRARLLGSSQAMGQVPLSLQAALLATPPPRSSAAARPPLSAESLQAALRSIP
eukprot:3143083-Prymnesium_polylepis.1